MENLRHEEAAREGMAFDICKRFSMLGEERLVIETMAYSDKYKKILDGICNPCPFFEMVVFLCATFAMKILMASIRATGANDSSKLIPSS
ncbi:hypothetical protein Tco_0084703 [Tanacetum coccineum]